VVDRRRRAGRGGQVAHFGLSVEGVQVLRDHRLRLAEQRGRRLAAGRTWQHSGYLLTPESAIR
jgi:hypothetical protein